MDPNQQKKWTPGNEHRQDLKTHCMDFTGELTWTLFWANYNDQTPAGWSPQMVVKSKGNPRKFQKNPGWWNIIILLHLARLVESPQNPLNSGLGIIVICPDCSGVQLPQRCSLYRGDCPPFLCCWGAPLGKILGDSSLDIEVQMCFFLISENWNSCIASFGTFSMYRL